MTSITEPDREVGLGGRDTWLETSRNGERAGIGGAWSGKDADGAAGAGASFIPLASPSGICQGNSSSDLLRASQGLTALVSHSPTPLPSFSRGNLARFCRALMMHQGVTAKRMARNGMTNAIMISVDLEIVQLGIVD